MHLIVAAEGKSGKSCRFDLKDGEIDDFADADDLGVEDAAFRFQHGSGLRFITDGGSEHHPDAVSAFDDVKVGDDVPVGIDDDARAETAFSANTARGGLLVLFVRRAVPCDQDFHHCGRNSANKAFKGPAHLVERVGGSGRLVLGAGLEAKDRGAKQGERNGSQESVPSGWMENQ